jgi:hypothetical protein
VYHYLKVQHQEEVVVAMVEVEVEALGSQLLV